MTISSHDVFNSDAYVYTHFPWDVIGRRDRGRSRRKLTLVTVLEKVFQLFFEFVFARVDFLVVRIDGVKHGLIQVD
jgi:hypothetical protein